MPSPIRSASTLLAEFLSGPLRRLKVLLLGSWLTMTGVFAILLVAGVGPAWFVALGTLYAAALLILVVALQTRSSAKLNDLHYEQSLQFNLRESGLAYGGLFLDGAAANPSLLLTLFKVLAAWRPRRILELGSGQTTKLLSRYRQRMPDAEILTLEENASWFEQLSAELSAAGPLHDYRLAPLETLRFEPSGSGGVIQTAWYGGFEGLSAKRFQLLIVDGPVGSSRWSRSGFLRHLPAILDESWVIIVDDAERPGEAETIRTLRALLTHHRLDHVCYETHGVKSQFIAASKDLAWLQYT